jgi:hypothetical protein
LPRGIPTPKSATADDELYYNAIISDKKWNILSKYYDEKQQMDMVFTVGQCNLVSWMLNSFGVQLKEGIPGFPEGSDHRLIVRYP